MTTMLSLLSGIFVEKRNMKESSEPTSFILAGTDNLQMVLLLHQTVYLRMAMYHV